MQHCAVCRDLDEFCVKCGGGVAVIGVSCQDPVSAQKPCNISSHREPHGLGGSSSSSVSVICSSCTDIINCLRHNCRIIHSRIIICVSHCRHQNTVYPSRQNQGTTTTTIIIIVAFLLAKRWCI